MTMPKVLLALGPIVFRDFELPPEISFGGAQRLVTHHLANGRRVIDCLGRDDADIRFSGVLAGPDATSRALALDELRGSGVLVPLSWDLFFYSVLIKEFSAQYRNDTWIPYALRCAVARDESEGLSIAPAPLAQLLADDLNTAASGGAVGDVDFAAATSAVSMPGATVYGSAAFQTAWETLRSVESLLMTRRQQAEVQISSTDILSGTPDTAVTALSTRATTARQLALVTRAHGFVGRAAANLGNQGDAS